MSRLEVQTTEHEGKSKRRSQRDPTAHHLPPLLSGGRRRRNSHTRSECNACGPARWPSHAGCSNCRQYGAATFFATARWKPAGFWRPLSPAPRSSCRPELAAERRQRRQPRKDLKQPKIICSRHSPCLDHTLKSSSHAAALGSRRHKQALLSAFERDSFRDLCSSRDPCHTRR
jgi:hypothetical protein